MVYRGPKQPEFRSPKPRRARLAVAFRGEKELRGAKLSLVLARGKPEDSAHVARLKQLEHLVTPAVVMWVRHGAFSITQRP